MPEINVKEQAKYLNGLGYDTIPLAPNSKSPVVGLYGWQDLRPEQMWAGVDNNSNIGIRCGGEKKLVVIDCDDKDRLGTFDKVRQILEVEGFLLKDFPVVKTASSIGRHIYAAFPKQYNGHLISIYPTVGSGEIRYGTGAYVVAPPSCVAFDSNYKIIKGSFENLPLLPENLVFGKIANANIPSEFIKAKELTSSALELFTIPFRRGKYPSRSEAEMVIICSLIREGFSFEEILENFLKYIFPGKFQEEYRVNKETGLSYLRGSYENGKKYVNSNESEGKRIGELAIRYALQRQWAGRNGQTDRATFLALANIAIASGKTWFNAAVREVAERASMTSTPACTALGRLRSEGLIHRSGERNSYLYKFNDDVLKSDTYNHTVIPVTVCTTLLSHDAFRRGALNKTGFEIYQYLHESPRTMKELIKMTGRCRDTIKNRLEKMSSIGDRNSEEILELVQEKDGMWYLNKECDLDDVARILGSEGRGEKQKERHKRERFNYSLFKYRRNKF